MTSSMCPWYKERRNEAVALTCKQCVRILRIGSEKNSLLCVTTSHPSHFRPLSTRRTRSRSLFPQSVFVLSSGIVIDRKMSKSDGASDEGTGYRDYANVTETALPDSSESGDSSKKDQNFPVRLHYMLSEMEKDGQQRIVCWQPHGRCFIVNDQETFVKEVLPMYVHVVVDPVTSVRSCGIVFCCSH